MSVITSWYLYRLRHTSQKEHAVEQAGGGECYYLLVLYRLRRTSQKEHAVEQAGGGEEDIPVEAPGSQTDLDVEKGRLHQIIHTTASGRQGF